MSDKNFRKINIKTVISIYQCTPVANFSSFGELQIWAQICLQNISDKNLGEINTKIVINIYQCTSQPNFSQFGELKFLGLKFAKKTLYDGIGLYNLAISRK